MRRSGTGSFPRTGTEGLRQAPMPLEWLDRGTWRLPCGKALIEFALQSGFLAPLLLNRPASPCQPATKRAPVARRAEAPSER